MTIEEKQQELEHNIRKLYSDIADDRIFKCDLSYKKIKQWR